MYLKTIGFMFLFVMCYSVSPVGQTTTVWKAMVRDSSTLKPLSNVLIYVDQDTIGVRSNSAGEFQVSVAQPQDNRKKGCY